MDIIRRGVGALSNRRYAQLKQMLCRMDQASRSWVSQCNTLYLYCVDLSEKQIENVEGRNATFHPGPWSPAIASVR